jgi:protein gp37
MAATSAIEWTDATVNFWWGCTEVGPGCDHCYARTLDRRTGGAHWGVGARRRKIKSAGALIHRLDNGYADWSTMWECRVGNARTFGLPAPTVGPRRRVFIQSMSDLFDLEVELSWFAEAWDLIEDCHRLEIQIVTKRISAVEKRLKAIGRTAWPKHAGLILTVVNQDEADRDISRLLALMERLDIPWIGLSCEPLLGSIELHPAFLALGRRAWVITGYESGPQARARPRSIALSIRDQCKAAGVAYFHKQNGEWIDADEWFGMIEAGPSRLLLDGKPWQPPKPLNFDDAVKLMHFTGCTKCQHNSDGTTMIRVGKAAAGRLLDGAEHNEFPELRP